MYLHISSLLMDMGEFFCTFLQSISLPFCQFWAMPYPPSPSHDWFLLYIFAGKFPGSEGQCGTGPTIEVYVWSLHSKLQAISYGN